MSRSEPATPPLYYDYAQSPLKIVSTPDGWLRAYRLNSFTGRFDVYNRALRQIASSRSGAEIFSSDEEEFIRMAETRRAGDLRGDGPIFTVYRLRHAMEPAMTVLGQEPKQLLRAAVPALDRWTFQMWEEEFARQDAGHPPSFHYEPVAPPEVVARLNTPDPTPDLHPSDARRFLHWA